MLKCCFGMNYTDLLNIIEHAANKHTNASSIEIRAVAANSSRDDDGSVKSHLDHIYFDLSQMLASLQKITQAATESISYFGLDEKCNSIIKQINCKLS